jgi:hypothetical protein
VLSRRVPLGLLTAAVLLAVPHAVAHAQDTAGASAAPAQPLALVTKSFKIIPPATALDGTFSLINTGRAAVALNLEVGDLLEGDAPLPGMTEIKVDARTIEPGGSAKVRLIVKDMFVSASATVALTNNGTRIGDLVVIRYPVAVTIDELKPGSTLATRAGAPTRLTLRNPDRTAYTLKVGMSVGAYRYCQSKAEVTKRSTLECSKQALAAFFGREAPACEDATVHVPAAGMAIFSLDAPCASSSGFISGLIKDEERDGTLSVYFAGGGAPETANQTSHPVTQIPFTATVGYAYLGPVGQQLWGTLLIALVLTLGGVCSLISRHWVPNELARRQLLQELDRVDASTGTVSGRIGTELALLTRVEAKRLIDQVRQVLPISADSEALLTEYRIRLGNLGRRLQQLKTLDEAWDRLRDTRTICAPPSEVHGLEDRLEKIAHMLRKTELTMLEGEQVGAELDAVLADVDQIDSGGETQRTRLKEKLELRLKELREATKLWSTDVAKHLRDVLPGAFGVLDGGVVDGESWSDAQVEALIVIRDYIRLHEATVEPRLRQRLKAREPELVKHLSAASIESLRFASGLVREIREGIYEADLVEALQRKQARIHTEPRTFQTFQLFRLTLRFDREDLNSTAAQAGFRCEWHFPGEEAGLGTAQRGEEGWFICHYLTSSKEHEVNVDVYRVAQGTEHVASAGAATSTTAQPPVATFAGTLMPTVETGDGRSQRMRAELIGLGVVLLIALLGLVTGAREQITKLDIVPGMIAVFLLGFSADSVKGLLTTRAPGGEAAGGR